jgi:hypothetical protein
VAGQNPPDEQSEPANLEEIIAIRAGEDDAAPASEPVPDTTVEVPDGAGAADPLLLPSMVQTENCAASEEDVESLARDSVKDCIIEHPKKPDAPAGSIPFAPHSRAVSGSNHNSRKDSEDLVLEYSFSGDFDDS